MGIDEVRESDDPEGRRSRHVPDHPPRSPAETRGRFEYYNDLRTESRTEQRPRPLAGDGTPDRHSGRSAESDSPRSGPRDLADGREQPENEQPADNGDRAHSRGGEDDPGRPAEPDHRGEPEARDASWNRTVERFRDAWKAHCERWPEPAEGSGRSLDAAASAFVDRYYERITETERDVLTPAMREIEAQDPTRQLAGLEHRLKSPTRLKEKLAEDMLVKRHTAAQATDGVKDVVRYTFVYLSQDYTPGAMADVERLKEHGFEGIGLRNSWADAQYRGINSRWRDPDSGVIFEVQFHTNESYEAKELTHHAYERLRVSGTEDPERNKLCDLQAKICQSIHTPPGARRIRG